MFLIVTAATYIDFAALGGQVVYVLSVDTSDNLVTARCTFHIASVLGRH